MLLPVLVVAAEAIRANAAERRAVEVLGEGMARTRTYSELEGALQAQAEVIWRALSGFDGGARNEYRVAGQAVDYWQSRWQSELRPEEAALPERLALVRRVLDGSADSIFTLVERGRRDDAWAYAQSDLRGNALPALVTVSRDIYGQLRQTSVRGAFVRLEEILAGERRTMLVVLAAALTIGVLASLRIARGIGRPVAELRDAMAQVGTGRLDAPIPVGGRDEIGQLAAAFARMRDDLRTAQSRIVQAEKLASIGEMSAAVAHGLRNPLAGLRASAQLAERLDPASPAFAETLRGLVEEADRLDRRVTHLLSFSRPAAHHPSEERPAALVASVLPAFAEQCRSREIRLVTDVPEQLPAVLADPMQLEQVLVELVGNAMQAMPDGGTLTVRGRLDDERVLLEVQDSGVGIPPQTLAHVCDPFFTTRPDGTGLGLAVAKRFVEQNGGALAIDSTPGRGTTVRVTLPAVPETAAA